MPLSPKDVRVINAQFLARKAGLIVYEAFVIRLAVMNTIWMAPYGSIHFETELPEGCSVYMVNYLVGETQVNGMVIVPDGVPFEAACLDYFTEQRDITKAPVVFQRDWRN